VLRLELHLLRRGYGGLFLLDSGGIALDSGSLRAKLFCWSKLSQFGAELTACWFNDTEGPASVFLSATAMCVVPENAR
jgi:hypothetical protein